MGEIPEQKPQQREVTDAERHMEEVLCCGSSEDVLPPQGGAAGVRLQALKRVRHKTNTESLNHRG